MGVHLEAQGEGVGQPHRAREGGQQQVAHLDAAGRDAVAQPEVVLAQKLWEVVQQHQQHPQRALQARATPAVFSEIHFFAQISTVTCRLFHAIL